MRRVPSAYGWAPASLSTMRPLMRPFEKAFAATAIWLTTTFPAASQPREIPRPIYGLTLDGIDHLADITDALRSLSRTPTTRVVFDEGVNSSSYMTAVRQIYPVSFIMGEILDPQYVSTYSVADYSSRAASYLNTLGSYVDLWEVGNEVNGEWLGSTPDVVAKIYNRTCR